MVAVRSPGLRSALEDWADGVVLAQARRRYAIAFLAGAAGALALPPLNILPALFVSFPALVLLIDGLGATWPRLRDLGAAALTGWWFGFGYFLAGLWWLGVAFLVEDQFKFLMPLGVIGLPAGLALFFALGTALARLIWSSGSARIFALAAGLGFSEWLRSWLFTGFPWNAFGQSFADHLVLAQIVSITGADALGVLVIAIAAAPVTVLTGATSGARFVLPVIGGLGLLGFVVFGYLRLAPTGGSGVDFSRLETIPDIRLRIMQPSIPQDAKNHPKDGAALLEHYFSLSDSAKGAHASGIQDVTHLVWPESPFPFVLERNPQAIRAISQFLPARTQLITGAIRAETDENAPRGLRFFNSLQVLDRSGITGTYDKVHLVPFGEYLPFDGFLRKIGLEQFVRVVGGFSASPERRPLDIVGLPPVIPMICFETIFSRELGAELPGPRVLLNVTNDAWFGYTFGPYQHFAQARLRAIEFGQPLIRAANNGISAVFDPYGRAIAVLPLNAVDVLDAPLPAGLANTLYRQTSWYSFVSVMICFAAFAVLGRGRG